MSRRYIDLDSATRNRVTYPKVGDFVVQVNAAVKILLKQL